MYIISFSLHIRIAGLDLNNLDDTSFEDNIIQITNKLTIHPYFDFDVPRNVTTRVGQTAFVHCRVEQIGDKSVSVSIRCPVKRILLFRFV